ncbi:MULTISPECIES: cytochrome c family protein [Halomonadaceae]|uniref:c-type cytochrome n=1 Tax=Halomonadaceae TaxID=28256 RepID=UPI001ABF0343|nr:MULTISPECIES: c-type cytochrome [Halomonas]
MLFGLASASWAQSEAALKQGERIFRQQCSGCHVLSPGIHRAGPSLYQLMGRPAGSVEDFAYSAAFDNAAFNWTPEMLDAFLADPDALLPGNLMVLWGLAPGLRAPLIDYLQHAAENAP